MNADPLWNPSSDTPDPFITTLESHLRPLNTAAPPVAQLFARARQLRQRQIWHRSLATAGTVAAAASVLWVATLPSPWRAASLGGSVRVDTRVATGLTRSSTTMIETGSDGRASLNVARVGVVHVAANTRLRVDAVPGEPRRITLDHGHITARIAAAPREVVIHTASAAVIDLGCVYSLESDSVGNGVLTVTEGRVELRRRGISVIVPGGFSAALSQDRPPGLPVRQTASSALKAAVRAIDLEGATDAHVQAVLDASDSTASLTLWSLLSMLRDGSRDAVVMQLQQYVPMPASVTRDRILAGDLRALAEWQRVIERRWSGGSLSWWRRALMIRGIWQKPVTPLTVR